MPSLGDILREAREAKGASYEDVEAFTHIRAPFVEALEQERFDELPGPVYVKGFLRNYALYLGLAPQTVTGLYQPEETVEPKSPEILTEPLVKSLWLRPARLGFGLLLIAMLVAFVLWWSRTENRSRFPLPGIGFLANRVVSSTPTPSPTAASSAVPATTKVQSAITQIPTDTPVRLPSPTATPTPGTGIKVFVVISDTSWVEVISDGDQVFAKIMNPGETGRWEAHRQLALKVGNAGGVFVTVNNRRLGLLGQIGDVASREWIRDPAGKLLEQVPTPVATYTPALGETPPGTPLPDVTGTPAPGETPPGTPLLDVTGTPTPG